MLIGLGNSRGLIIIFGYFIVDEEESNKEMRKGGKRSNEELVG